MWHASNEQNGQGSGRKADGYPVPLGVLHDVRPLYAIKNQAERRDLREAGRAAMVSPLHQLLRSANLNGLHPLPASRAWL